MSQAADFDVQPRTQANETDRDRNPHQRGFFLASTFLQKSRTWWTKTGDTYKIRSNDGFHPLLKLFYVRYCHKSLCNATLLENSLTN